MGSSTVINFAFSVINLGVFDAVVTLGLVGIILFGTTAEFVSGERAVRADRNLAITPGFGMPELEALVTLE